MYFFSTFFQVKSRCAVVSGWLLVTAALITQLKLDIQEFVVQFSTFPNIVERATNLHLHTSSKYLQLTTSRSSVERKASAIFSLAININIYGSRLRQWEYELVKFGSILHTFLVVLASHSK